MGGWVGTERQKGTSVDLGPRPKRTNVRLVYIVTGAPPRDDVLQHGRRGVAEREEEEGDPGGLGEQVDEHYEIGAAATTLASRILRYCESLTVALSHHVGRIILAESEYSGCE